MNDWRSAHDKAMDLFLEYLNYRHSVNFCVKANSQQSNNQHKYKDLSVKSH